MVFYAFPLGIHRKFIDGDMERIKGRIFYYSGTGNTRLACQYIAKKCRSVEFRLHDILSDGTPDLDSFGLVGFAAFADYLGPSKFISDFVRGLPKQQGKPAFVLSTFGAFNGATLRVMAREASRRGFSVCAGYSLHTPENHPPHVAAGQTRAHAPDAAELVSFDRFIAALDDAAANSAANSWPRYRPSLLERLVPALPRTTARNQMGPKSVDAALCTRCGICAKVCPYDAVTMPDLPAFDQSKCYGCWACYNRCPTKAIYTRNYRGIGHYPEPIEALKAKLRV